MKNVVENLGKYAKKGAIPWNKGTKGVMKPNKTSFKKGHHSKTEFKKGHKSWLKGKKMPRDMVEKSRLKRIGRKDSLEVRLRKREIQLERVRRGEHNLYKGGITSVNKRIRGGIHYRLWREAVYARDNWTCQRCGKRGVFLHPHHIKNFAQYPKLRFAIDNGITLCKECHMEFHKKYGKENNNEKQLKEFLARRKTELQ